MVTTVGGQLISQSQTTLNTGGPVTTITEQQWDGTAWHATTTGYFPDDASAPSTGRIQWIENADGTASTYAYGYDNNGNLTSTVSTGAGNRNGITDGTKVLTTMAVGNIPIQQTTTDIASNLVTESWITDLTYTGTYGGFDVLGRPVKRIFNSDLTDYDIKIYACCGLQFSQERDGSTTTFSRDGLKRVYQVAKQASTVSPAVSTFTVVDGLTTTRTRTVAGASGSLFLGTATRSLDGLTETQTGPSLMSNNAGDRPVTTIVTAHGSNTGDTVTTTYADGSTSIFSNYLDGRIKSASGSAIAPMSYDYGTWSGGTTATTLAIADTTANTGVTTITSTDLLGRTVQSVSSATGTATSTYYPSSASAGSRDKLASVTDADGVTLAYGYNAKGERVSTSRTVPTGTSSATQVTASVNDVVSDVTLHGNSLGISRRQTQTIFSTGVAAVTTSQSYFSRDGLTSGTLSLGRQTLIVTTRPDSSGVSTRTTTAIDGTRTVETTTNGLITQTAKYTSDTTPTLVTSTGYNYDTLQRPATSVDSRTGTTTYSNLTESGKPLTVTNPHGDAISYACDIMGRDIATTLPDSSVTNTSYYPTGKVKAQWGSQTNPTWYEYDAQNRLKNLYTWQTTPSLTQSTVSPPSGSAVTTWSYGSSTGLLSAKTDNAGNSTNYAYTTAGRLFTRTWARSVVTTYAYTNGFLTGISYSDGTTPNVAITYDALGRKSMVSNGVATSAFSYDPTTLALTQESVTYNIPGLSAFTRVLNRSQDSLLRDTGWLLKAGDTTENQTTYGYSATDGRLSTVADASNGFTYAYETNSNLIATVTRDGSPVIQTHNNWEDHRDVLTSKQNKVGTTVISEYDYTVNSMSQRTNSGTSGTAFTTAPVWTWGYDSLGQITSAASSVGTQSRAYQYDAIGNRVEAENGTTTLTGTPNYTTNALNQYTAIGGLSPEYDNDGNATAYPLPAAPSSNSTLTWDAENRMVSSSVGASTTAYYYDAFFRRIARKTPTGGTSLFVYDGWNCIAEYTGTTPSLSKANLWGLDLSGSLQGAGGVGGLLSVHYSSNDYSPTYDGNGNVSEYLSLTGSVAAHFEYDPFGNTVVNTDSMGLFNNRFSTKSLDLETGLYYYGYRYYDPHTGRWINRDPIGEASGVNIYADLANDAVNQVDVLGLQPPSGIIVIPSNSPALAAAHQAGTDALKTAQQEYEREKATDKNFNESGPREYGGLICKHCENGVVTYYTTIVAGTWKSKISDSTVGGTVDISSATTHCNYGDEPVGTWHIHPGKPAGIDGKGGYGQGPWISGKTNPATGLGTSDDLGIADGINYTDPKTKERKHFKHRNNPGDGPVVITRSTGVGQDTTETFAYKNGQYYQYKP